MKAGQKLPKGAVILASPRPPPPAVTSKPEKSGKAASNGATRGAGAGQGEPDAHIKAVKSKGRVKQQQLVFERTTGSATWPSEKNPLKDFDADFLKDGRTDIKGFPHTTGDIKSDV